jgi:hypothetical protein
MSLFVVYLDWVGTTAGNLAETVQNTWHNLLKVSRFFSFDILKGLPHEIDFKDFDKILQN